MNTTTTRRALVVLTLLVSASLAVAGSIEKEPGYIDLDWIEIPDDADEIHDIDLTTMLIDLADDAREEGEAELAELLGVIRSVRLRAFSLTDRNELTEKTVQKMLEQLEKSDWNRMIYMKSGDEVVSVSTLRHDGDTVGLTVVAYDPEDGAVFINVVGDLDFGTLLRLASEYDMDDLDEMISEHKYVE